jgi:hypothetical protein
MRLDLSVPLSPAPGSLSVPTLPPAPSTLA